MLQQQQLHKKHESLFPSFIAFRIENSLILLPRIENPDFYETGNVIFGIDSQMYFQKEEYDFEELIFLCFFTHA